MLKGLVTLTNSVICPLSYNCVCSNCFGGGTAGQLSSHLLFGGPPPLPRSSRSIAEPGCRESEPCSTLALGGGDREVQPSLHANSASAVPSHCSRPFPPLTPHIPSAWPLASKSINTPSPLPEEEALSASACGQQCPDHLPRLALKLYVPLPIARRCQTHLFCEHKEPGRL